MVRSLLTEGREFTFAKEVVIRFDVWIKLLSTNAYQDQDMACERRQIYPRPNTLKLFCSQLNLATKKTGAETNTIKSEPSGTASTVLHNGQTVALLLKIGTAPSQVKAVDVS